jgi:hypothetical protein
MEDEQIHGDTLILDRPLPKPVLEYDITLTEFDNGLYGASVCIKGDEMGYGTGQCTREQAIDFIVERLNAE